MDGLRNDRQSISYDRAPSDSEPEDETRLSSESARNDHDWLEGEQDQERLLSQGRQSRRGLLERVTQRQGDLPGQLDVPQSGVRRRSSSAQRQHGRRELIHKIEEGGSRGESPLSDESEGSSERDREKMGVVLARKKVMSSDSHV